MPAADQIRHEAEQEGQKQGGDVSAVHVGVGHENDFVVAQPFQRKALQNPGAECGDHGFDLRVRGNLVHGSLLHVEDFAPQGQHGLIFPAAGSLGGAARGVSLHDEQLAVLRIAARTVRQLSGQGEAGEGGFPAGQVPGAFGRVLCLAGQHGLAANGLGRIRVLFQKQDHAVVYQTVHRGPGLAAAQLLFGLALKLWVLHADADDGGQTLGQLLAAEGRRGLLQQLKIPRTVVQRTHQGAVKTGYVGAALRGGNVVDKAVQALVVTRGVLNGKLHLNIPGILAAADDFAVKRGGVPV